MPDVVVVTEPGIVTVSQGETLVTVYDGRGLPGPAGAAGAAGAATLNELTDVTLVSVVNGDLLKYSSTLAQWTNSNTMDGGNF